MGRDLGSELLDVLDAWQGQHVAVRVVAGKDHLIAVFRGTLRTRSPTKGSSLFWPVELDRTTSGLLEQPGVYAYPALLSAVRRHVGGFVVDFTQAGVTVNVRRLHSSAR
jgi:hypothetical protein